MGKESKKMSTDLNEQVEQIGETHEIGRAHV